MATQQPTRQSGTAGNAEDLLRALLEAPPRSAPAQLLIGSRAPVATPPYRWAYILRALDRQLILPGKSLRSFGLRPWAGPLLEGVERFLIVFALLVFGYWLAAGPARAALRDEPALPARLPLAIISLPTAPRLPAPHVASAPPTTIGAAPSALEGEFQAPRQGIATAPRDVAAPPTHLLIPSIKVDSPIKEIFVVDFEWQVAEDAAGYLHGSGLPGDPDNMALAGHAGLFGGVFRDLGELTAGDEVYVDAAGWRYSYRVRESKTVWPNQIEVLDPTPTATLTLLTCTNWDTQRLVVVADLIGAKPLPGA